MLRSLFRFRTGLRSLSGIERQLERLADAYEADLASRGIFMRDPAKPEGPEPELSYTDEEADYVRELKEKLGKGARE